MVTVTVSVTANGNSDRGNDNDKNARVDQLLFGTSSQTAGSPSI